MLNSIFFNANEMAYHQRMISDCEKQCGAVLALPGMTEQNKVKGVGLTTSNMLQQLQKLLNLFLHIKPQAFSLPIAQMQLIAQIDSMTYCTYLGQTIAKQNPHAAKLAPEVITQFRGYFLFLGAIIAANLAEGQHHKAEHSKAIELVVAALKWMEDAELNHMVALQDQVITPLRQQLIKKLIQLQLDISKAQGSLTISPDDMQQWVDRKNQRAVAFCLPYQGVVVYSEAAFNCYLPDPDSLRLLFNKIASIASSDKNLRQQILFYFNISTGHVELLDVAFDAMTKKLSIINVSSTNMVSQYYFIQTLSRHLKEQRYDFELVACQANIQRDGISCSLYAFALSSLVAKLSFQAITAEKFRTTQPLFYDVSHRRGHYLEPLENIAWCSIHALGVKAILMSQSFTFMRETLEGHYKAEEIKALITEFKDKYGLVESPDFATKRDYIDYLRWRLTSQDPMKDLSIDKLKRKCKVQDNGQLVRRAVNYCTKSEFSFLISEFSKLSLDKNPLDEKDANPEKGYTPLMLAINTRKTPGRAIALLQSGCVSVDKNNAQGKSAKHNFSDLPSDSAIAQNQVLQRFLK